MQGFTLIRVSRGQSRVEKSWGGKVRPAEPSRARWEGDRGEDRTWDRKAGESTETAEKERKEATTKKVTWRKYEKIEENGPSVKALDSVSWF